MDRLGRRGILDQLEQPVPEHHLARRDRQIATDLERMLVGHRHPALLQVVKQVGKAREQTLAPGLDRLVDHFGVQRREIGRAHRIDELARLEVQPLTHRFGNAFERPDHFEEIVAGKQIAAPDQIEGRIFAPLPGAKAPVGRGRGKRGQILSGKACRP